MDVVLLHHGGVPCILPAARALSVSSRPDEGGDASTLVLWQDEAGDAAEPVRWLRLTVAGAARSLPCTRPRTTQLPQEAITDLPPLVRSVLDMPWVTGLARIGDRAFWVLDVDAMPQGSP